MNNKITTKLCNKCNSIKPINDFGKDIRTKDQLKCFCKSCTKQYNKDYNFKLLLYRVKTHSNIGSQHSNSNKGCIDNVIFITRNKKMKENIKLTIIGNRKKNEINRNKHIDLIDDLLKKQLSDHSPVLYIENLYYAPASKLNPNSISVYNRNSKSAISNTPINNAVINYDASVLKP